MPEHPLLLEALGFVLWYLYTDEPLETSSMAIADGRWELILGVYKISDLFRLDEPKQYYGRSLRAAIDAEQEAGASLDELHLIAIQAVKWDCVDISEQSTKRFMDVAGSALTDPKALSLLSPDSFERILENTDVSGRVELVGAFFKAKKNAGITVPLVSADSIWILVTFDKSTSIQEIEELHNSLGQAHPLVLDAAANALMDDPSALSGCSMAFFLEVADRATVVWRTTRPPRTPSPRLSQSDNYADSIPIRSMSLEVSRDNQGGWTPAETYTMVRGYIAIHRSKPWMTDEAKQKLWNKVPFMELPQAILQRADVEGIAPKKLVNNAFLKKIRSSLSSVFQSEAPSPKSSPNRPTSMPPAQTPPQRGNDHADQDSDESILSSPPQNGTSQSDSVLFAIPGRRSSLNSLSVPGGHARAQSDSGVSFYCLCVVGPIQFFPTSCLRRYSAIKHDLSSKPASS
ncbi:hypothetical protein M427DRAFT_259874 [Gonapodya prolifera JEL478]|uniref:Uncharacterized protein n=1 Tax=Gonapodya prolifera (strain JEL478) TaxID=1344416 RepID=A0A139AKN2_GONPJ|nr:hypothetical protein M427DRAFT_259874 [Gonapodya prolifera JEL478]|eukprot:KXS17351.1 hypothetical protein M427DRAFT_259874 [Gonapodya prolifera JEL478]